MHKISVIICAYNRASLLPKAIDSVLAQTFSDFEILIIDDGSSDDTPAVAARYVEMDGRIKYFRHEKNLGISASRNHGAGLAQGEYIAMLDSDDYWLDKDKLAKQFALLVSDSSLLLSGTAIVCVDENGNKIKEDVYAVSDADIRRRILSKNQFAQSSIIFRKDAWGAAGKYDESLSVCEDLDLWLRMGLKGKFSNLPDITTAYLINTAGESKTKRYGVISITDRLVNRHRRDYPAYWPAQVKSWLRFIIWRLGA